MSMSQLKEIQRWIFRSSDNPIILETISHLFLVKESTTWLSSRLIFFLIVTRFVVASDSRKNYFTFYLSIFFLANDSIKSQIQVQSQKWWLEVKRINRETYIYDICIFTKLSCFNSAGTFRWCSTPENRNFH